MKHLALSLFILLSFVSDVCAQEKRLPEFNVLSADEFGDNPFDFSTYSTLAAEHLVIMVFVMPYADCKPCVNLVDSLAYYKSMEEYYSMESMGTYAISHALNVINSLPVNWKAKNPFSFGLGRKDWHKMHQYVDADFALARKMGIKGFPTILIVDDKGNILYEKTGNIGGQFGSLYEKLHSLNSRYFPDREYTSPVTGKAYKP